MLDDLLAMRLHVGNTKLLWKLKKFQLKLTKKEKNIKQLCRRSSNIVQKITKYILIMQFLLRMPFSITSKLHISKISAYYYITDVELRLQTILVRSCCFEIRCKKSITYCRFENI